MGKSSVDAVSKSGGNIVVSGLGTYQYNPPPALVGTDTFTYRITDANGRSAQATGSIAIAA